jgi:hypothetical protein
MGLLLVSGMCYLPANQTSMFVLQSPWRICSYLNLEDVAKKISNILKWLCFSNFQLIPGHFWTNIKTFLLSVTSAVTPKRIHNSRTYCITDTSHTSFFTCYGTHSNQVHAALNYQRSRLTGFQIDHASSTHSPLSSLAMISCKEFLCMLLNGSLVCCYFMTTACFGGSMTSVCEVTNWCYVGLIQIFKQKKRAQLKNKKL